MMGSDVTVVITSCNRFDLLKNTLRSFFKFNTYPLNKIIIIEDGDKERGLKKALASFDYDNFEVIVNHQKLGQLASIDRAYGEVTTDYIFHCEDDWEFFRSGFIECSKAVLEQNDKIQSVWLREISDFPNMTFSQDIGQIDEGCSYRSITGEFFSLNPGLIRLDDYRRVMPYAQYGKGKESTISKAYEELGFISVILNQGAVCHIGQHRRVMEIYKERPRIIHNMDAWLKRFIKVPLRKVFKKKKQ